MPRRRRRIPTRLGRWFDDARLSYAMITALERFLSTFSAPFVVIIGLLSLALIGLVDAVTGSFAVAVFYLVPIGLVTYARGRWVGTLMAATAAFAWTGVELAQHITALDSSVTYLNWLTRFYVYEAVALLVAPLRDVVSWEREVAAREAEATDKLRALNELRLAIEAEEGGQLARLEAMVEFQRATTQAEIAYSAA
jgi:K+-sensing histidine kinase KdpD